MTALHFFKLIFQQNRHCWIDMLYHLKKVFTNVRNLNRSFFLLQNCSCLTSAAKRYFSVLYKSPKQLQVFALLLIQHFPPKYLPMELEIASLKLKVTNSSETGHRQKDKIQRLTKNWNCCKTFLIIQTVNVL